MGKGGSTWTGRAFLGEEQAQESELWLKEDCAWWSEGKRGKKGFSKGHVSFRKGNFRNSPPEMGASSEPFWLKPFWNKDVCARSFEKKQCPILVCSVGKRKILMNWKRNWIWRVCRAIILLFWVQRSLSWCGRLDVWIRWLSRSGILVVKSCNSSFRQCNNSRFLVITISAWFNSWMQLEYGEILSVSGDILWHVWPHCSWA